MLRRAALPLALALTIGLLTTAAPADATPASPSVAARAAATTKPAKATLKLKRTSAANPIAADWITAKGTTSKNLDGRRITVQKRAGTKAWSDLTTVKVSKKGVFAVKVRATGVGAYSFRVRYGKTRTIATTASKAFSVTVSRWYSLSTLDDAGTSGNSSTGAITMAGQEYFQSVLLGGRNDYTMWSDYNASYKCTRFAATLGVADDAPVGTTLTHTFLVDSTPVATATTALGKSSPLQVDITGAFRIRLQSSFAITGYGDTHAGWGDAQMLCSGDPTA